MQLLLMYLFLFLLNKNLSLDDLFPQVYLRWTDIGEQSTLYTEIHAGLLSLFKQISIRVFVD